jgi:hypothetical protein
LSILVDSQTRPVYIARTPGLSLGPSFIGGAMNQRKPEFNYVEEAHVTASNQYYGERVGLSYFQGVLADAIDALNRLDAVKKTLFYGKETGVPAVPEVVSDLTLLPQWIGYRNVDANTDIIHAIIGKATEAGELLEALLAASHGNGFDVVNGIEEVGDGFWYDALFLRAVGSSFEESQRINIQKLRARFGEKFSEYDANNRDLFKEREILEAGSGTVETMKADMNGEIQG